MQCVAYNANAGDIIIGCPRASIERVGKACKAADGVQSEENRIFYETEEEKHQFIHDSFKLDENEILNSSKKLKEAVIQLF